MLASSIKWILVISGIPPLPPASAALLFRRLLLGWCSGQTTPALYENSLPGTGGPAFVVCSLTIYAAFFPDTRGPILTAKF